MTYEQAVRNQWAVAYHRMLYAKQHEGKQCRCDECKEHLDAIAKGPTKDDAA